MEREDLGERRILVALEPTPLAPVGPIAGVARIRGVVGDDNAGFGRNGPEPVVHRVAGRTATARTHDRTGAHDNGPCSFLDGPVQVLFGGLGVDQGHNRRRHDPIVPGESPVFIEPPIEGAEHAVESGWIMSEQLFDSEGQRRQEEGRAHALCIQCDESPAPVPVLGSDGLEVAHERLRVGSRGVLASEVVRQPLRFGYRIEGGVGDHPKESVTDEEELAAVLLDPPDGVPELGLEKPGKRVHGFVEMLVSVAEGHLVVSHEHAVLTGYRNPYRNGHSIPKSTP